MVIRWLDIGSGTNPFYYSPPFSITVNKKYEKTGDWFCDVYAPEPHISKPAQSIRLRSNSVENILFHFSIGRDRSYVLDEALFFKTVLRAYSWIIPGGSIIVRSIFHGKNSFNPRPFYKALVAAGFKSSQLDIIKCSDAERLPAAAKEVLLYCEHHEDSLADGDSSFLIATKGDS